MSLPSGSQAPVAPDGSSAQTVQFEVEKKAWAEEKIALTHRDEKAEAALEEVTTELSDLRRHVSQMVSAIFGKLPYKCQVLNLSLDHMNCL